MAKVAKKEYKAVTKAQYDEAIRLLQLWKTLHAGVKALSGSRGVTLPSEITEVIVAYHCGLKKIVVGSGDLINEKENKICEIKGSCSEGPNSFSPSEIFDELVYIKLSDDEKEFRIYKTGYSSEKIKKVKVNKTETLEDQQKQGRRPRFSIQKQIIEAEKMEPTFRINSETGELI